MGRFWLAAILIFLIGFAGCISPPATVIPSSLREIIGSGISASIPRKYAPHWKQPPEKRDWGSGQNIREPINGLPYSFRRVLLI